MCLEETFNTVHVHKHLSHKLPIKNGLKQGYALAPLPVPLDSSGKPGGLEIK
jgi:hypothetical protein